MNSECALNLSDFFSNRTFYKQRKLFKHVWRIKTTIFATTKYPEFVVDILIKFRDWEVENNIRQQKSGSSDWLQALPNKEVMMEISRLCYCFQSLAETSVSFEDMYTRESITSIKEAINKLCEKEREKHGLNYCLVIMQNQHKI